MEFNQLGNALYPLIEDVPAMEAILNSYSNRFDAKFPVMMQENARLNIGI